MISIVIIVRNDSVRQFIGQALESHADYKVTGIYESTEEFLRESMTSPSPQVILLDNSLQANALRALRNLKRRLPTSEVVLFTFADKSEDIYNAFCAGASGYILQSEDVEDMIRSIQDIMSGDMIVLPSIAQKILHSHTSANAHNLTKGEVQLMLAIANGQSMPYIRDTLKVPAQKIRSQIKSIFSKLHISTQTTTASN